MSGRIAISIVDFWYTNKVHYLTVSIGKSRRNPGLFVKEGISHPLRHTRVSDHLRLSQAWL
jgi:hypothetical protein